MPKDLDKIIDHLESENKYSPQEYTSKLISQEKINAYFDIIFFTLSITITILFADNLVIAIAFLIPACWHSFGVIRFINYLLASTKIEQKNAIAWEFLGEFYFKTLSWIAVFLTIPKDKLLEILTFFSGLTP